MAAGTGGRRKEGEKAIWHSARGNVLIATVRVLVAWDAVPVGGWSCLGDSHLAESHLLS